MKPEEALRLMIKLYSPYSPYSTNDDFPQYLIGTAYDKFGCLLALNNTINNFNAEHALAVGANFWKLIENDADFVQRHHKQLGELLNAAKCLDTWNDLDLTCDQYKANLTFNLALAIHLPIYDDGDFLADLMEREPRYGPFLIFENAVSKRWYLVLIILMVRANHYYSLTNFDDIPSEYTLPKDIADEVRVVANAIAPEIGRVVGIFIDRTIGSDTELYRLDRRCTNLTLRARNIRTETSLQNNFPNFHLIADASNSLVARVKHYQQEFRFRVFEVLLGAVTSKAENGTGYKENIAIEVGHNFAKKHHDYAKLTKLFSGRQRSTAAERTIVLSYLIANYCTNEISIEWFKGCARCGNELLIFSEFDLQQVYELLSAADVQIKRVVFVCPDNDSWYVVNDASELRGISRYCIPMSSQEAKELAAALDAHLTSTNLEQLKMWRVREINDSYTLGIPVFGDETLAQLLGYQEMCPYFIGKFNSILNH
ncbi:hypothetical protein [Vibrio owensii]|uniref:Uncharacterized protein n=1 Tax=Vibrio owensii CAIM 1854 = LMG 25443 TaxID=1229493 RepID=A0A0C1ZIP3_9VIBR|nr:hypothetical protein [Vibrio owensii]KIF53096.1 hypothetical protein H735_09125 [Vibrio owensii CAIM 1854 = LMG 25443]